MACALCFVRPTSAWASIYEQQHGAHGVHIYVGMKALVVCAHTGVGMITGMIVLMQAHTHVYDGAYVCIHAWA